VEDFILLFRSRSTFAKVIVKIKVARFFMAHGVHVGEQAAITHRNSHARNAVCHWLLIRCVSFWLPEPTPANSA